MNEMIIEYRKEKDVWFNGEILAKAMQSERQGHALRGFFFDYGMGETSSHKNYSAKVKTDAGFLMGAARDAGRPVRIFKNMNGEIAAAIK